MEYILNPSLDTLFLHERVYLEECCVAARSCRSIGRHQVSAPFQSWDQNPRGTLSPIVSAAVPDPHLLESPAHLNLNGCPAWEMPRALTCFSRISAFSKLAPCSDPHLYRVV